jgi:rSAM/selenodomain-associated transferase 2
MSRISLIIPTLNEAAGIVDWLKTLPPDERLERIVVDGGSSDGTADLAKRHVEKVLVTKAGRGRQMNAGALHADGDTLLFLHADSMLPDHAVEMIWAALDDPLVVGGAFHLGIDSPRRMLGLVATVANWRTRLTKVPYGDQGIFVRRSVFDRLGGYPDLPIMEDLEFSRRLKSAGKVVILSGRVMTSPRRWDEEGAWYTTLRNQVLVMLYFLGVSPARLARWYRVIR